MQMLAMEKFLFLNSRSSRSGYLVWSACTTKPTIRASPSTKLTRTGVLVKLPVIPTSESE